MAKCECIVIGMYAGEAGRLRCYFLHRSDDVNVLDISMASS